MKLVFTICIISFLLFGCKKDEKINVFVEPIDTLPAYTDTGAKTMGCMFGAKVISAINYIDSNYFPVVCNYDESSGLFRVYGERASKSGNTRVEIILTELLDTGRYVLKDKLIQGNIDGGSVIIDSLNYFGDYSTTYEDSGFVYIRKLDKVNNIISGEFEFRCADYFRPLKQNVTLGRFDAKYR